jgi:2Fe-2S ferredoxin
MAENNIEIFIENEDGSTTTLDAPVDMGLSLMEFLKAMEYPVLATCGGMALCATCCIDVLEGAENLSQISDDEYAMLDTLPDAEPNSRLACQLKLNATMQGLRFKLHPVD